MFEMEFSFCVNAGITRVDDLFLARIDLIYHVLRLYIYKFS